MTKSLLSAGFEEWVSSAVKGLFICIFSMFTFFASQLSSNIAVLTTQFTSMDKRISAIEISREVTMEAYKKVVSDVEKSRTDIQDLKSELAQLGMRIQTVADVVAKHLK